MQHIGHHGVTAKHSSSKHASRRRRSRKHNARTQHHAAPAAGMNPPPVTVASPAKPRRLSPGIDLCPAEAVAAAARIAGWMVTDEDVLDLYWRCADGPSAGFTIAAALMSSSKFGIGNGFPRPVFTDLNMGDIGTWAVDLPAVAGMPGLGRVGEFDGFGDHAGHAEHQVVQQEDVRGSTAPLAHDRHGLILGEYRRGGRPAGSPLADTSAALILGVDLPGPHAVTVAPDGCWVSWGEHWDPADFPGAAIEEAWAVSFA